MMKNKFFCLECGLGDLDMRKMWEFGFRLMDEFFMVFEGLRKVVNIVIDKICEFIGINLSF